MGFNFFDWYFAAMKASIGFVDLVTAAGTPGRVRGLRIQSFAGGGAAISESPKQERTNKRRGVIGQSTFPYIVTVELMSGTLHLSVGRKSAPLTPIQLEQQPQTEFDVPRNVGLRIRKPPEGRARHVGAQASQQVPIRHVEC